MPARPWHAALFLAVAIAPAGACASGAFEPVAQAPLPPVEAQFQASDRDGSGALSEAELVAGLAPAPADEARRIFAALDRDQDGQLALAEYAPDPVTVQAFGFTSHSADQTAP